MNLNNFFFRIILFKNILAVLAQESVLIVPPGAHTSTTIGTSLVSFNFQKEIIAKIKFSQNAAEYLFEPTDPNGYSGSVATNKLFGGERCLNASNIHGDSDRFVWRRVSSCLIFSGNYVLGERCGCADKGLIEVLTYTYDNGSIPYQNIGVLQKAFRTKIRVETWYIYKLITSAFETVYQIFDQDHTLLESINVPHRDCGSGGNSYRRGVQALYFGGSFPAPQSVSATYSWFLS